MARAGRSLWAIRCVFSLLPALPVVAETPLPAPNRTIEFTVSEGTGMAVDVSPDGKELAFDLLGHIYVLPIGGGEARALTQGWEWNRAPQLSPDGKEIAMIRDEDGPDEVWIMPAASGQPRRVSDHSLREGWAEGAYTWTPDGRAVILSTRYRANLGNFPLKWVEISTGKEISIVPDHRPPNAGPMLAGAVSPDGRTLYLTEFYRARARLVRFDGDYRMGWQRTVLTDEKAEMNEFSPQLSRDGRWLAFIRDSIGHAGLRVRDLTDNIERELLALPGDQFANREQDGGNIHPKYAFTPDGAYVVIGAGGKIHKVAVADGRGTVIPFTAKVHREARPLARARLGLPDGPVQIRGIQWPRLTLDGKTLVFSAAGYLWVQALPDGQPRRLTRADGDRFEIMPALSPDGKRVAYVEYERRGLFASPGRLVTAPLVGGTSQVILSDHRTYQVPSWSPDGTKLAFVSNEKGKSMVGWIGLKSREPHWIAPIKPASRGTWDRLVFLSRDGRRLLYSTLLNPQPRGACEPVELREVALSGNEQTSRRLMFAGRDVCGVMPSPGGRRALILGLDSELWSTGLSADGSVVGTDLYDPKLERLTSTGGEFVDWRGDDAFIYSFGNKIYRYTFGEKKPQLLHTVELQLPRHEGKETIAITNARIITMSSDTGAGEVLEKGTLIVKGRRIATVGPARSVKVPAGARVIDAAGLTLMPGIGDTHYHSMDGYFTLDVLNKGAPLGLPGSVQYGVTFGWQPGAPSRNGTALALHELRETGRVPGPRWIYGPAPSVVNLQSWWADPPQHTVNSYEDALRLVRHQSELGSTVLKEYRTRRRDHRRWYGDAARELGLGIVSHLETLPMLLSRAADGYTGGDHAPFPVPLYDDVRQFLARTGTMWTLDFDGEGWRSWQQAVFDRWPEQRTKLSSVLALYGEQSWKPTPPAMPFVQTRTAAVARAVKYLMEGGVNIGFTAHGGFGFFTHAQLWYLQEVGTPRGDILRAATLGNAYKLGLERDLGSLEAGKIADILVLTANPLEDVLNTLSLKYVLADGVVHDPQEFKNTH